jgi:hypothetical protein
MARPASDTQMAHIRLPAELITLIDAWPGPPDHKVGGSLDPTTTTNKGVLSRTAKIVLLIEKGLNDG